MSSEPSPETVAVTKVLTGDKNERGIPKVVFIENVDTLLKEHTTKIDVVLEALQQLHSKYRFMETNLKHNKSQLKMKIPEIEKTLSMVRFLAEKKEAGAESVRTHFSLADALYATADVKPTGTVCLWLGANVMLEYPYDEAEKLLATNLDGARAKLDTVSSDLMYLRDQIITTEVNIARCFNFDVVQRRNAKAAESA